MIKKLLTFIKHDFISQMFSLTLMFSVIYSYFLLDDMSILTKVLGAFALILGGYSAYKRYTSNVTVRYELIILIPIAVFTLCLFLGVLHKYNELNSIHALFTYASLSGLIDLGLGAFLLYGSFMALLGFSCILASKENFEIPSSNIEVLTGNKPDFIHYRITKSSKTLMTLKDFTFCAQGLVRNEKVVGYHELYNYMKEQDMRFNALTDDDFLVINMVKI